MSLPERKTFLVQLKSCRSSSSYTVVGFNRLLGQCKGSRAQRGCKYAQGLQQGKPQKKIIKDEF